MLRQLIALAAAAAAFATPVTAANIEWETVTQYSNTPVQNIHSGTDAGEHSDAQIYGLAYVALQPSPFPAILAHASVNPVPDPGSGGLAVAEGILRYDYTYTAADQTERSAIIAYAMAQCGGRPGCNIFNVPLVTISGRLSASSGPNGHAEAQARAGAISDPVDLDCLRGQGGCGLQQFTLGGALMATSGLEFHGTLELSAYARADGNSYYCYYPQNAGACDRADAWIDPVISLNSGFAWTGSLVLTPGFVNVAGPAGGPVFGAGGVPEPAEWALLLTGFGLAGAVSRRRSRPTRSPVRI